MNMTYKEFIKLHMVAADYKENENNKCEAVPMVSVVCCGEGVQDGTEGTGEDTAGDEGHEPRGRHARTHQGRENLNEP